MQSPKPHPNFFFSKLLPVERFQDVHLQIYQYMYMIVGVLLLFVQVTRYTVLQPSTCSCYVLLQTHRRILCSCYMYAACNAPGHGVSVMPCRCYDVTMPVTHMYVYVIQCKCNDVTMLVIVTGVYIMPCRCYNVTMPITRVHVCIIHC